MLDPLHGERKMQVDGKLMYGCEDLKRSHTRLILTLDEMPFKRYMSNQSRSF